MSVAASAPSTAVSSSLATRVVTAAVLVVAVLAALYLLPPYAWGVVVLAVVTAGAHEWGKLIGLHVVSGWGQSCPCLFVLSAQRGVRSVPAGVPARRESGNREELVSDASHRRDDADHRFVAMVAGDDARGGKHALCPGQRASAELDDNHALLPEVASNPRA